jgi:hypothetical protein
MIEQDRHAPSILRFAPVEWKTVPQLNSCPPGEWTKTGRSLLFEIKINDDNRIAVALVLGPSDEPALRRKIYEEAERRKKAFLGPVKPMGKKWSTIYSKELLSASEAKGMSYEEQVEAVEAAWQNFVDHDFPTLTAEVLELLGKI